MTTIQPAINSSTEAEVNSANQPPEVVNDRLANEQTPKTVQASNIKTEADVELAQRLEEEEKLKKLTRALRIRIARDLVARIRTMPDGSRMFVRFGSVEVNEHWVLLVSFSILGFTGLLQRYTNLLPVTWITNNIFGGIATLRSLHHIMAFVLGLLVVFHILRVIYLWFVKRIRLGMLPEIRDIGSFAGMIAYNLGIRKRRPVSDRYTIEQKLEYWMAALGIMILGISGLVQWFPSLVTQYLPGTLIPLARTVHSLQAVLSILIVLIWHLYNTVLKEKNASIFDGLIAEKDIQEKHPIEYYRILKASEFIKDLKARQAAAAQAQKQKAEPASQIDEPVAKPAVE